MISSEALNMYAVISSILSIAGVNKIICDQMG